MRKLASTAFILDRELIGDEPAFLDAARASIQRMAQHEGLPAESVGPVRYVSTHEQMFADRMLPPGTRLALYEADVDDGR